MKQTTVRFSDDVYRRVEAASDLTGLPINSIVTVACLEWLERHAPADGRRPRSPARSNPLARLLVGRPPQPREDHFTPAARAALEQAAEEARALRHPFIGSEHLLLAIAADPTSPGGAALAEVGVTRLLVLRVLERLVERGVEPPAGDVGLTQRAKRAVERAATREVLAGDRELGTEHLLLGVLGDPDGLAARVLDLLGVPSEVVRAAVERQRSS